MADLGDIPIHFDEYQFTLADASFLSGVPQKTIRNWLARDVLRVGKKHFLGRWTFSFLDAVRLAVMRDLTTIVTLPLADAARLADLVAEEVVKHARRDASGKLLNVKDGRRPNVNILVGFGADGQPKAWVANIKEPGRYYAPHYKDHGRAALRRTHIVIPVTAILTDTLFRIEDLARRGEQDESGDD